MPTPASARLLSVLALAVGCWLGSALPAHAQDSASDALPARDAEREAWAARLNAQRAAEHLAPVLLVPALSAAAQAHVADMEARGYFDFTSPTGMTIEAWVHAAGYEAQLVTEKLARTDAPPDQIAAGWGRFPESQKSSLFHPEVQELGVGIGHQGKIPIYAFVLARSREVALEAVTAKLLAAHTARLADLPTLRQEVLAGINRARTEQGMPPLAANAILDGVAQTQAELTLRDPARQVPEQGELARRAQAAGFPAEGAIVGEDVVRDALDAESTVATLLHNARKPQVLHKAYTHLGLGVASVRRGDGFAVVWVVAVSRSETESSRPPQYVKGPEDPRTAWLRENAVVLRPLTPPAAEPADEDFADLQSLRAALAGSRIVLLGEITHGDGASFRAKSRLVRFLHRELGFSVLAFESGFFDCAKAWELLSAGEDATTAARRAVFGIWSGSAEVRPLLADLGRWAKTPTPLELAGFDSQFTGTASADFLVPDLERYLRSLGAPTTATLAGEDWKELRRQLGELIAAGNLPPGSPPPDRAVQDGFARALDRLDGEIAATAATPESAYWRQLLRSVKAEAEIDWGSAGNDAKGQRRRDRQMAENLLWLARVRYPGRKIVVWAATRHILYNPGEIRKPGLAGGLAFPGGAAIAAMGDEVRKVLGREVYALGFATGGGAAGKHWEAPQPVLPPPAGSLEDLWGGAGADVAFLDFRHLPAGGAWLHRPLVARPLGLVPMQADWTRILDGMIYLRTMTPATHAGSQAGSAGQAAPAGTAETEPVVDMRLRYAPPGRFVLGSPPGEEGRMAAEDAHPVTLTRGFWIGETEVTQGQWQRLTATSPSYFAACGADCPVEMVNWYEAVTFANRLSERSGVPACYELADCRGTLGGGCGHAPQTQKCSGDYVCATARLTSLDCRGYRLPTEAEWEYAARAGGATAIPGGELPLFGRNFAPALDPLAWYGGNSGIAYPGGMECARWAERQEPAATCGPHPVAGKRANAWGLYDVLGNVMEMTEDRARWDSGTERLVSPAYGGPATDPLSTTGPKHVLRGGSWYSEAWVCRLAWRGSTYDANRVRTVGFRLVRTAT